MRCWHGGRWVADMVVDMEVAKGQTGTDYLAGIPGVRAVLQFLQCLTFPNDGIDTKSNSLDPSVWFAHMSLAYQPCDQPCRHILSYLPCKCKPHANHLNFRNSYWSHEQFIVYLQRVNGQGKYTYMETIWRKGCPNDIFQSRHQRQRCSMIKPTSMQIHELTILISVHCTFRDTILVCCRRRIVQSLYSLHCYCARVQVGFTQRGRLQLGDGVRGGNSGFFCFCLITRKRFNRRRLDTKLQIQRFSEKAWWIEFREEDAAALLFTGQKSKLLW